MAVSQQTGASRLAVRLGFWSALLVVVAFVVFTVCFVGIALNPPLFIWTNLTEYLAFVRGSSQLFANVARLMMLLFGPLYVVLLNSIYEQSSGDQRLLARISLCFSVLFAVLSGINYFVQLSAVRLSILNGSTEGLEQIVQANPYSAIAAINLLGWSAFLGLSSLFIAPVFAGPGVRRLIRYAFVLNGVCCLLGGLGYMLDNVALVFVTLNLGMGGAILLAASGLCVLFRRLEREI